jgi:PAS domain S-box-containing protein
VNIGQKCVLMISAPVVLELILVGGLLVLLQQAEQDFDRQERSKELLMHIHEVATNIGSYFLGPLLSEQAPDLESARAIRGLRETLERADSTRKAFKETRPELRSLLDGFDRCADASIELSKKAEAIFLDAKVTSEDRGKFMRKELYEVLSEVHPVITELLRHEQALQSSIPEDLARRQTLILYLLAGCTLASVGVSALIARTFETEISRRLHTLGQRATMVALELPLPEQASGKHQDELSELDAAIRQASEDLNQYKRRELALAEFSADALCVLDAEFQLLRVSPAGMKIWWMHSAQMRNRSVLDFLAEADMTRTRQAFEKAKTQPVVQVESKALRTDGALVPLLWSATWNEEEQRYYAVAHDRSEKESLEAMKRRVVSMISHDVRAPMASMLMNFESLEAGVKGPLPEDTLQTLRQCRHELSDAMWLVESVLELEKLRAGETQINIACASLADVGMQALARLADVAEAAGVKLPVLDFDFAIAADEEKAATAVAHILHSLITSCQPGDEITITLSDGVLRIAVLDKPLPSLSEDVGGFSFGTALLCSQNAAIEQSAGSISIRFHEYAEDRVR